jgi:hypothetical protein
VRTAPAILSRAVFAGCPTASFDLLKGGMERDAAQRPKQLPKVAQHCLIQPHLQQFKRIGERKAGSGLQPYFMRLSACFKAVPCER